MSKLYNISEVSKILNLINPDTEKPQNYILRYWEKEFKIVKAKKINNRRYYTSKQLEILKMIKFLLKNKGLTILGVKNLIDSDVNKLDDYNNHSLKADYYKNNLKLKSKKLLNKIKQIKNYGKKISS
ncbi:MerR family transcriptional regulator [Pelagibacteraceae bacterium]|jgi:DNA-binding transcriptional MerR regulator|nr:MerR family transcriptional regulator [Pelagibacteraceae bacterium]|tara:strand:+ start:856 stop:1236 length:381 start_codon:yes stop_codon:yes gene_type:complete